MMKTIRRWIMTFLKDERGAAEIIAVIVLVAIAIILAIAFREQISELLTNIWSAISGREGEITADLEL